jgi:glycosyltransferase involved in cell wall biosynthesis
VRVSVIISTYNRPEYLRLALKAYLNQTVLPEEIVIADDGSSEETERVIKEFENNGDVKIIHCWHEDRGFRVSEIRNKAVALSSGQYIIFSDDDTIPSRYLVEDHIRYAERGYFIQGHRVLLGPKASEYFKHSEITYPRLFRLYINGEVQNISNSFRFWIPIIMKTKRIKGVRSCNMSMFRDDFIAVNGFNEEFQGWGKEDTELVVRLYKYGLKRKDIKFRANVFHLYHDKYNRDALRRNIELLERTLKSDKYYCKEGIDKYL